MLRTLGGKNIGKCRLRAHQHPLLPPLPNLRRARPHANIQGKTRARVHDGTRAGGCTEDGLLRASILDFRARLANRCRDFPVYPLFRALILDFKPKLANRCRVFPVLALFRASILDFRPRLANRCTIFPVYTLLRASILDFKPRLGNRCKLFPVYPLFRALILNFKHRLANHCRVLPGNGFACNGHRGRRRGLVPRRRHNPK